jgi:hypothetical protein
LHRSQRFLHETSNFRQAGVPARWVQRSYGKDRVMLYSTIVERTVLRLLSEEQHLTVDEFNPRQTELRSVLRLLAEAGRVEIVATDHYTMTYQLRTGKQAD